MIRNIFCSNAVKEIIFSSDPLAVALVQTRSGGRTPVLVETVFYVREKEAAIESRRSDQFQRENQLASVIDIT